MYELYEKVTDTEEALSDAISANVVLAEDNNVKSEIIKNMRVEIAEASNSTTTADEEVEVLENISECKRCIPCDQCNFVTALPNVMKGQMTSPAAKTHSCKKCNKKFQTNEELSYHTKTHENTSTHDCSKCAAKFLAEHALKQHVAAVHKETSKEAQLKTFKCRLCGNGFKSGADLDNHLAECANQALIPDCTFHMEGRCTRGSECRFSHPPRQVNRTQGSRQDCTRGPQCRFLRAGKCDFFHPWQQRQGQRGQQGQRDRQGPMRRQGSGDRQGHQQRQGHGQRQGQRHGQGSGDRQSHQQRQGHGQRQGQRHGQQEQQVEVCTRGFRCRFLAMGNCHFYHDNQHNINQTNNQTNGQVCYYQEDCDRVPNCPFIHSNEDFPVMTGNQRRN